MKAIRKLAIALLAGLSALIIALSTRAEVPPVKTPRIGYVSSLGGPTFEAFRQGLRDAGYREGGDVILEAHFTGGKPERFPSLIAELLGRNVDVLVAGSPPGAAAAMMAQTVTPIVIAGVVEPLALAARLGRPTSHVTGSSVASKGLGGSWVDLVREARPNAACIAVLANPSHAQRDGWLKDIIATASAHGIEIVVYDVGDAAALETALGEIGKRDVHGLIVTGDPVFLMARDRIIAFASKHQLAAVYFSKLFADSGGLIAYGGSLEDSYRKAAQYADRIIRGAKPAELAVQPTAVELVINLRTAKAMGIALPARLVERADKVIE